MRRERLCPVRRVGRRGVREEIRELRCLFAAVFGSIMQFATSYSAVFCREKQNSAGSARGFLNRWPGVRVTPGASRENRKKFPDFHRWRPGRSPGTPLPIRILGRILFFIARAITRAESRTWS